MPDIEEKTIREYLEAGDQPGVLTESLKPVADLFSYFETRREAAELPWGAGRQRQIVDLWRTWLDQHPQSVRREAAMFQMTRALCRSARGWTRFENAPWPAGGLTNSLYPVTVTEHDDSRPSTDEISKALAGFEIAFPKTRYAADLQFLKGTAAIDRRDYETAFDLLVPLLEDGQHRELHTDAALHLADVFLRLREPEERAAVLTALRSHAPAREMLQRFMQSDSPGGRLALFRLAVGL